ncbi:hypothetical protein Hanom_Chr13g01237181 [Helianthus anomalus]
MSNETNLNCSCGWELRTWGMIGRGLGAWCDTWTMGHPRPKANFKGYGEAFLTSRLGKMLEQMKELEN